METVDDQSIWWRCAYSAYLDSGKVEEFADDDEAKERAVCSLQDTISGFLEGMLNFGTLKYRMDNASAESGYVFPARSISSILSDLALGVDLDVLEPALRRAGALPEDPGEAKGLVLDLEDLMENEASKGRLKRPQVRAERWPELLACLWHVQDPTSWPLVNVPAMRYLQEKGEICSLEPAHDYAEYASVMRRLASTIGADMTSLEHLLASLPEIEGSVPGPEDCFQRNMELARQMEREGAHDQALDRYERALSIRPSTAEAFRRKATLYEMKGLIMAAIGELETLIELEPRNLEDHRRLLALYKGRKMIKEYNVEVRRFKAIMGRD